MKRMTKTLAAGIALLLSQASLASAADLVWWTMNWNEQMAKDYVAEFMKENPDVTIRVEANVAGGLQSRILGALQSGSHASRRPQQISCAARAEIDGKRNDVEACLSEYTH